MKSWGTLTALSPLSQSRESASEIKASSRPRKEDRRPGKQQR